MTQIIKRQNHLKISHQVQDTLECLQRNHCEERLQLLQMVLFPKVLCSLIVDYLVTKEWIPVDPWPHFVHPFEWTSTGSLFRLLGNISEYHLLASVVLHSPVEGWQESLKEQDIIEVQDTVGNWYVSRVSMRRESQVHVTYLGWEDHWDEWIDLHSKRLAPLSTKGAQLHNSSWKNINNSH
jgi:hypothetical protein